MRDGGVVVAGVSRSRWTGGLDWTDATVVILASGPSLSAADCEIVRAWRNAGLDRRVIAINTTFQRAPWADVVFACDARWWDAYAAAVAEASPSSSKWTQEIAARDRHGVNLIQSVRSRGLYKRPGAVHQGFNSGYMAIGLAYQFGAARIVLLGYDMQKTDGKQHWHGDHPRDLHQPLPYALWLGEFAPLAADLREVGVEVVNATRATALKDFPQLSLEDALS